MYGIIANNIEMQQANCVSVIYWAAWILILFELIMQGICVSKKLGYSQGVILTLAGFIAGPIIFLLGISLSLVGGGSKRKNSLIFSVGISGSLILSAVVCLFLNTFTSQIVALGLIGSAGAIRNYFAEIKEISVFSKIGLCALRIALIFLICIWVINPVETTKKSSTSVAKVLIAVDKSASMKRKDMPADWQGVRLRIGQKTQTRISSVKAALAECKTKISELKEKGIDVEFFSFADKLAKQPTPKIETFITSLANLKSLSTDIGDSMLAGVSQTIAAGQPIAGVVMLTDGCNNYQTKTSPTDFVRQLKASQIDLYPVMVGAAEKVSKEKVLNISGLDLPDSINTCTNTEVKPSISAYNLSGQQVEVICKFGKKIIGKKIIEINKRFFSAKPVFNYTPLKPGSYKVSIYVRVLNSNDIKVIGKKYISKLVNVSDKSINVLYIEGKFRYESKYIARAIGSHEKINLTRYTVTQSTAGALFDDANFAGREFSRYHIIILGDVAAKNFTRKQIQKMADAVIKDGCGLCMIGGYKSFGAGGWDKTPLVKIMPIDLSKSNKQINTPVKIIPTKYAAESVMMKVSNHMSLKKAWESLDKMPGANKLVGVKPAAEILAKSQAGDPMIVTQRVGAGRATAIAFDTTWRWVLSPSKKDTSKLQQRFWQQVVMSLTSAKETVWIEANKAQYDLTNLNEGEKIIVTAGVSGIKDEDVKKRLTARLVNLDNMKTTPIALEYDGKKYRAVLETPKQAGNYQIEAKLKTVKGNLVADYRFEINFEDREAREILANEKLMKQIAAISNSKVFSLPELPEVLEMIGKKYKPVTSYQITTRKILAPCRNWFILLMILLICSEWFLRKKKSLV